MSKSKWPNDGLQLDVTCYAANVGKKGEDKSLSIEQRNEVIRRLIDKLGGVQDPGIGIVILPLLEDDDFEVQLWVHDWE